MKAPKLRKGSEAHVYFGSSSEHGLCSVDRRLVENPIYQKYFAEKVFPVMCQLSYHQGFADGVIRGVAHGVIHTRKQLEKESNRKAKKK